VACVQAGSALVGGFDLATSADVVVVVERR
jgi:hypothetical protein